ncbi:MAG TPA: YihY/virulence factor BrkB family protein, partial [Candidatus Hydrogenedentes bacterium]|nr:YihY/virulence factor BrkB family protein [Candidatus Hydrogenedentota bacterium]
MKEYVQRLVDAFERGRRFVAHDVWQIGQPGEEIPHGFVIKQVRVVILLVQGLIKDALLLRAAALTFATILSIIPILVLMFYFVERFDLADRVYQRVYTFLSEKLDVPDDAPRGYTANAVGTDADESPAENGAARSNRALIEDLARLVLQEVDQPSDDTQSNPIKVFVEYAEKGANPHALTLAGIVFVVATTFGLMTNIENSFNSIWGMKRTRSWYRIFTDYTIIVLLLPFLLVGVLALITVLKVKAAQLGPFAFLLRAIPYGVTVLAFASLYHVVPNTRVKIRYALLGGVVAGILWSFLSLAYVYYARFGLPRYSLIYGTLAQFPLLLIWVYLSWTIVLFGAELSFAYQNEKTFSMERLAADASHAYREALGLRAMVEIGRRFDQGIAGLAPAKAAEAWRVPTRLLNDTLDQLEEAGLVAVCATEPPTYQPGRSLDKVTVNDVLRALREAGRDPSVLRADAAYGEVLQKLQSSDPSLLQSSISALAARMHA